MTDFFIVIFISVIAWGTSFIFNKLYPQEISHHEKYGTIDGLRGYLAILVFIHHSAMWFFYLHTKVWTVPKSIILSNIGGLGVTLFFMITAFLFSEKIKQNNMNWRKLYLKRIFRLSPLFLFSLSIMLIIVLIKSNLKLNTSLTDLVINILKWIPFSFGGRPDINNLTDTRVINAGVTWSLVYEWFFYFSLPTLYFLFKNKVMNAYVIFSAFCVIIFFVYPATEMKIHLFSFFFGALSSYLIDNKILISFARSKSASLLVMLLLSASLFTSANYYNYTSIGLSGVSFIFICCGCNLLGLLENKTSKILGSCTYSIYLLHGIVLFVILRMCIPINFNMSEAEHWITIFLITPIVISISLITYNLIEKPFMRIKIQ
ncbi:acyltransferase [Xenorhabdus nematophila]|uniref:acyltransferase family protein n=1 Tax=Xenorhabdus nematophila TaxID=628 RepID=UPI0032B7B306